MLQRTEKGKEARQYFIKIEEEWKKQNALVTREQRQALALLDAHEIIEEMRLKALQDAERIGELEVTEIKYLGQADGQELYKIGDLSKDFGLSAVALNRLLHEWGFQYKPQGSSTWQLYTKYADMGIAIVKSLEVNPGIIVPVLCWTPKGRDFIADLMDEHNMA